MEARSSKALCDARNAEIGDLITADDGRLLVGVSGGGLKQLAGDKLESYPIRDATNRNRLLPDRDVDSNKLLRDRDGGLWIGTHAAGAYPYTQRQDRRIYEIRRALRQHQLQSLRGS